MVAETTMEISDVRRQLDTLDMRLQRTPIIFVTRHGKRAFALVSAEHLSAMQETMEILSDPNALRLLQQSLEDIRAGRVHDHDDVFAELDAEFAGTDENGGSLRDETDGPPHPSGRAVVFPRRRRDGC
jgi:prevent-host-death family protein